jgi:glycerol-3-phosphate dehydrogenase
VMKGIYYVESPSDGRAVFVMPWRGSMLVGTTETPYPGEPDQVHPLPEEEEYLLGVIRHYFPAAAGFTRADIRQRFAGLRVLPAASEKAFDRSRETVFTADRDPHPRVLSIYGGKLTGWRAAAAHVLERIGPSLSTKPRRAATDQLVLRSTL